MKVKGGKKQKWKIKNQQSLQLKIEYNKRDLFQILSDASLESRTYTTSVSSCAVFCKCVMAYYRKLRVVYIKGPFIKRPDNFPGTISFLKPFFLSIGGNI